MAYSVDALRILVTGAGGQLGQAFRETASGDHDLVLGFNRKGTPVPGGVPMDLDEPASLHDVIARARPEFVVHAASMTNVDDCERNPARAMLVNGDATGALASAAVAQRAGFLYVSTDYVFDGMKGMYREGDATNPVGAYGRSKLLGETLALRQHPASLIGRTSVVFGPHKKNFVTWLIQELRAGRGVRIVDDQWVSPTLTYDLSKQILALIGARVSGLFHTAGADRISRLDMAHRIADRFNLDRGLITPIHSDQLHWLAVRPRDSSLDVSKVSHWCRPMGFGASLDVLAEKLKA